MASLASAATVAASVGSLAGVRLTKASSPNVAPVKLAPARCSAKEQNAEAEAVPRRKMVAFAAAGVLAALAAGTANAEEEPKRGSPEAKKKYANICVSQPTASVCHN